MHTRDPLSAAPPRPTQSERARSRVPEQDLKTLIGHNGVIPQGEFSLAESAEEITLHMAHRIEDKLHSERKIRGEHRATEISLESIVAHLDKAWDDDAQSRLEELVAQILAGQADPRVAVTSFSKNLSHQYLAFQYVLQKGQQANAPEALLAELADARAELEELGGPAIRAELNTIDAAATFARDSADIDKFQRAYEDVVLGEATLAKTLSMALARFGGKRIEDGLKALIQALGLDLAAARPSVSKERIHALINDMYQLTVAVTVLDGCRELGSHLTESVQISFDEERLMQNVVNVINDKWLSSTSFLGMGADQGIHTTPDRVVFMTGILSVLKDLPVHIFSDDEARDAVLEAAQHALDAAIDEELI